MSTATAAILIFIGLWTVAQLPIGPSALVLELFTSRRPTSMEGLWEGALYVALIGFLAGAIVDIVYEGLARLERR